MEDVLMKRPEIYNTKTGLGEDYYGMRVYVTPEDIEDYIKTKMPSGMPDGRIIVTNVLWNRDTDGYIDVELALLREDQSIKW